MKRAMGIAACLSLCILVAGPAAAQESDAELIADAETAAPALITAEATIKSHDGRVLREGSNGWTCYPGTEAIGPMCNEPPWDAALTALVNKEPLDVEEFSISYMLAGDSDTIGASNSDPFATDPAEHDDWVKEGPHLMILVPDPAMLEGLSTDPDDPVYVMWKGTPYAHIMVKIGEPQ